MAFPAASLPSLNTTQPSITLRPPTSLNSNQHRPLFTNQLTPRHPLTICFASRRNQSPSTTSPSPPTASSKKTPRGKEEEEDDDGNDDDVDEDAFEALFSMLEEDLKNDEDQRMEDDNYDDDDDDISEEDLVKLQQELEEALGVGDDDDEVELHNYTSSVSDSADGNGGGVEEDEDEEDEGPVKLKNWQLRRLAAALKAGRRKTSIKSLAGELCLERHIVLKLLRDPPPNLVMLSAALPDKPAPAVAMLEPKPIDAVRPETTVEAVKSESEEKVPIHVMRHRWFAQKRLKKVHVETLERVYRRTKRPTNTMISSIVQVTNLPRKRVVKWFEHRRTEEGVPRHRVPYQRSVSEVVPSS